MGESVRQMTDGQVLRLRVLWRTPPFLLESAVEASARGFVAVVDVCRKASPIIVVVGSGVRTLGKKEREAPKKPFNCPFLPSSSEERKKKSRFGGSIQVRNRDKNLGLLSLKKANVSRLSQNTKPTKVKQHRAINAFSLLHGVKLRSIIFFQNPDEAQALIPANVLAGYQGSGPIQLWQFLLELLTDKSCQHCIAWTGDAWEFKLVDPDEVMLGTVRSKAAS